MKIAFFEVKDWEKTYLKKHLKKHDLFFTKDKLEADNAEMYSDFDCVSVFIYSKVDKSVLSKLSKVKLVTTRSTGFDHIDLEECKKRKITVSNVPYYGANTVAEHTFGLILSLSRKIPESVEATKRENFSRVGLKGFDLKGRTLGVIGSGQIGIHVIRIARGFQMKVLAYDVVRDRDKAAENGFIYVSLDELLKKSDIVTLHVPLNSKTKHMINGSKLEMMKNEAFLINTSRGGLIDTQALVKALQTKSIAGAGLDVLEEETFIDEEIELLFAKPSARQKKIIANHMLVRNPNVIITPHNAFNSQEALERILDTTIENIAMFNDKKPVNTL